MAVSALAAGGITVANLLAFLLADRAISSSGKDPAKALQRLQGREAFAEAQALGVLSEGEAVRSGIARAKSKQEALSPEAIDSLNALLGSSPEDSTEFNFSAGDLSFLEPSEVASVLDFSIGEPGFSGRLVAASEPEVPLMARGLGIA